MMKVLFITNVPSPYRVDFFNELGKLCELTVLFEKQTSDERDESWKNYRFENFKGVFLKGKSIGTDVAICFDILRYVTDKRYDEIICSNMSSPTGIIAIMTMKLLHIPYYLEADGGTAKSGNGIKEKIKKLIMAGAKGYFSTSKSCDKYFETYGARCELVHRYPFTSLKENEILVKPLSYQEKFELRKKLDLQEDKILISVGRFSYLNGYGKGYDTLMKVCEKLPDDIGVYIIGDKPTDEFVEWKKEKNLVHLHFLPFKLKKELFEYYQAADLSVLLTRGEAWGLVVNESMANGTPVLTTDACVAGLELIRNEENGYVVPVDEVKLVEKLIHDFVADEDNKNKMSKSALSSIRKYTIEQMAKIHFRILCEGAGLRI